MNHYPIIKLKPGKSMPVIAGHPWIFSNAIDTVLNAEPGTIVEVHAQDGMKLGLGTWNALTSIRVRMLTRNVEEIIDTAFLSTCFQQLDKWKRSHLPQETSGYRLVHAEADGLPGLIVDRYEDIFVFQLHTAGMDRLRTEIIEALTETFHPRAIVERSDIDVRKVEGLRDQPVAVRLGNVDNPVSFKESGITFLADVLRGQKTGFFLDQRDARRRLETLAKDRRVLNLFGYTGAFSLYATRGGAKFITTVDASHQALELAQKNFNANDFDPEDEKRFLFLEADVFDLLKDRESPGGPYDLIVCDPPALAKTEAHLPQAIKAYTDLNIACLSRLEPGGILVSSSCSGRVTPDDFRSLLRIAAGRAGRDVRVLDWINQPADHAERLAFPEGRYLKTAVLEVTKILH